MNGKLRVLYLHVAMGLAVNSLAFSQSYPNYDFPRKTKFENVRINTFDGAEILATVMTIIPETKKVLYVQKGANQEEISLALANVYAIYVKKGTQAAKYGLYGALAGLGASALLIQGIGIDDEIPGVPDPGGMSADTAKNLFFGLTGGGLGAGIIMGVSKPNYKALFKNGHFVKWTQY